MIVLILMFSIY